MGVSFVPINPDPIHYWFFAPGRATQTDQQITDDLQIGNLQLQEEECVRLTSPWTGINGDK